MLGVRGGKAGNCHKKQAGRRRERLLDMRSWDRGGYQGVCGVRCAHERSRGHWRAIGLPSLRWHAMVDGGDVRTLRGERIPGAASAAWRQVPRCAGRGRGVRLQLSVTVHRRTRPLPVHRLTGNELHDLVDLQVGEPQIIQAAALASEVTLADETAQLEDRIDRGRFDSDSIAQLRNR